MQEVHERLHVGNDTDCRTGDENWAVVHACKHTCHQDAVGYTGSLSSSHPDYFFLKRDEDLYLNMIDPPDRPLFADEVFEAFFSFAVPRWEDGDRLLIHCNQGRSRSPSLAMLFLSAHAGVLPTESFARARAEFKDRYPRYRPAGGIETYLRNNWDDLLSLAPAA